MEQNKDQQHPDLSDKYADEIDLAMDLADDPDYAAEVRGWES